MRDDGGAAFPAVERTEEYHHDGYRSVNVPRGGMSLRDYFAGQVLDMASHDLTDPRSIAKRAYEVADAMLAERKQ